MKNIFILILLIVTYACNFQNGNVNENLNSTDVIKSKTFSISDTTNAKSELGQYIVDYLNDPDIVPNMSLIRLIGVSFYSDKMDTLMAIEAFSAKPVISPMNADEGYEFKGWLYINRIPVLFYDKKNGYGRNLYYFKNLLPDTVNIQSINNRKAFSCRVYKVSSMNKLSIIEKIPEYRLK